jgi:hypothetical protein
MLPEVVLREGTPVKTTIALLSGLLLVAAAAAADEGCSKDTDCKGERICVKRECVNYPAAKAAPKAAAGEGTADAQAPSPVPAASAEPAAFRPLAPAAAAPGIVPAGPITSLPDTRHRHLGGYIRPDLGFGYFTTGASSGGTDVSLHGFAGTFGIAAGGALSENTILAIHVWDTVVNDPDVSAGSFSGSRSGSLTLIAVGPELTVYSQQNLYFSISPSLTRMTASSGSTSSDTNLGFGFRAAAGKEWWASDHWGLGLAGQLSMSLNEDSGGSGAPTWTSWAFTVAFSATYN